MRRYTFLLIIICFSYCINSQPSQQWVNRYNGPGNVDDQISSIAVDNFGNVFITGYSSGSGTRNDYATIKYNSTGEQQWIQRYNGTGNHTDRAEGLVVDKNGNVYVTGWSTVTSNLAHGYVTIKYNSSGVQQWIKTLHYIDDYGQCIAIDTSGNVYVTGYSYTTETILDYVTVKYDTYGTQYWIARYNGPVNGAEYPYAITTDKHGNVYVTGSSRGISTEDDYATVKYNTSGVQQWAARYNGPGNDEDCANSITVDDSGNVYVSGYSTGYSSGFDFATVKYNSSGVQQWVQRYNGQSNGNDIASSIAIGISGYIYITGTALSYNSDENYVTIKYNTSGVQQWLQFYNGPADSVDKAEVLKLDSLENVYVTGSSRGIGTNYDYATVKYNSSGVQQYVLRYNGPANSADNGTSMLIDNNEDLFVAGSSWGSGTNYDYATVKYSYISGINKNYVILDKCILYQNYPNPFNPVTTIRFEIPKTQNVKLVVYDILGNEVRTLVNEYKNAGAYEVQLDASKLSSGVYFYKLETEDFTDVKNLVIIK